MFDRLFGANFFNVAAGRRPAAVAAPVLDLRPPRGLHPRSCPRSASCREILPVFSRKPLFGYPFMVFSGVAIGFMGWGVWAHHMFAVGPRARSSVAVFSCRTMFIAVPTGVKIFNWIAHDVGRQAAASRRRCCSPSASIVDVHHRRPVGRHPRRRRRPTRSRPTPTTSSPTSTTCCSAAPSSGSSPASTTGGRRSSASMLEREARQVELLADAPRLQPDLRPDAHPRPAGHAAAHRTPTTRRRRASTFWNLVATDRRVHPRRRRAAVPRQHRLQHGTAQGAGRRRLDPWDARSSSG